jgi:protein-S-isoprenylcysteine O-methyltransferase Ste14
MTTTHKNQVHKVLAHSYAFFFFVFLVALVLDTLFPLHLFNMKIAEPVGIFIIAFASYLILWAQKTSRKLSNKEKDSKEVFFHGPYKFSRSPTHLGLFLLMLGFGIMTNAFFVIVFTLVAFFITKNIFIKKQERILEEKYGNAYFEYKKMVRF